ncbi:MAG TPA: SPOR domain-containing protein [Gammaproteobacteria bacterium]|nr:SPOR domain-containing protein [Gammaproteobacteria bacterium]
MRRLFLLLLLANGLLFLWNWFGANDDGAAQRAAEIRSQPRGGRQLVLLSELNPPTEKDEEPPPAAQRPTRRTAAAPAPGREPAAPAGAKSSSPPAPRPVERPAAASARENCHVLGPFANASEVQRLLARVESTPAVVERRWSSPHQKPGYWVHIPPADSSSEARAVLRRLSSLGGGSDIQLITSGGMRHAISLGIFSTPEKARRRMEEVQRLGFEVAINEVQIRKRQYWLALRGSRGKGLSRRLMDNLLKGYEGVKVERRPCSRLYR